MARSEGGVVFTQHYVSGENRRELVPNSNRPGKRKWVNTCVTPVRFEERVIHEFSSPDGILKVRLPGGEELTLSIEQGALNINSSMGGLLVQPRSSNVVNVMVTALGFSSEDLEGRCRASR